MAKEGQRGGEADGTLPSVGSSDQLDLLVREGGADFLDLGCSSGGSLEFAVRQFGLRRGIGVDIDPRKVTAARDAGRLAYVGDATALRLPQRPVRLAQGLHFLEHLPDAATAQAVVRAAVSSVQEAVFFQQPYFDADDDLDKLGLKLYWSDWHGHPNRMKVAAFVEVLDESVLSGELAGYCVLGRTPITSSDDPAVHPVTSPRDQHAYEEDRHGPKPSVEFPFPAFREIVAIGLRSLTCPLADRLVRYGSRCTYLEGSVSPRYWSVWSSGSAQGRS